MYSKKLIGILIFLPTGCFGFDSLKGIGTRELFEHSKDKAKTKSCF